jgi:hypothetical protein
MQSRAQGKSTPEDSDLPSQTAASTHPRLNNEQIHEPMHRRRLQALAVTAKFQDRSCFSRRNATTQITFEFLQQRRNPVCATTSMPDRIIHQKALGMRTICKKDLHAVRDRTFSRIEVIDRELFVFRNFHLFPERVDARVRGDFIFVVGGRQPTENEGHRDHVLEAMVSVRGVIERSGLIDDSLSAFLCFNNDSLNISESTCNLRMQFQCCLDGGLDETQPETRS